MSVIIETLIVCDGGHPQCSGNDWSADSRHRGAAEQRRFARAKLGWHCVSSKDFCPKCWKARAVERKAGYRSLPVRTVLNR